MAQLRPGVSEIELSQAENTFLRAQEEYLRVGEKSRRCREYPASNRKPEQYGYSKGCTLEAKALETAKRRFVSTRARFAQLTGSIKEQRRLSNAVDSRNVERGAEIVYRRTASGVMLPTRSLPAPGTPSRVAVTEARVPTPARRSRLLPIALIALGVVAVITFTKKR